MLCLDSTCYRNEDMPYREYEPCVCKNMEDIENSLTTLNKKILYQRNTRLRIQTQNDKEIARKRKRKLQYYSNIYVVNDPKHPENENKVFLYKFNKRYLIRLLIDEPTFEDEKTVIHLISKGNANFKLKIRKVDNW